MMEQMLEILTIVWKVLLDLAPWLLLGAAIGGMLHVLLPASFLQRQLSGRAGVPRAVALGVPLPLCSCGVIPVGMQLKKSGADNGAVVAFLISTPQTGVDSILVSASMLGWPFAIFKVVSAAVTGLVGGWLANAVTECVDLPQKKSEPVVTTPTNRFWALVSHSMTLLHSIWVWLLLGVVVSALIKVYVPADAFEGLSAYGGLAALLATLAISVPLYVCATASVPIAAALVSSGFPAGAALVFLMAGPATNVATMGAIYRTLGNRTLGVYLGTLILLSVACGWAFGFVVESSAIAVGHSHRVETWWRVLSAAGLIVLFGWFAGQDLLQRNESRDPCCEDAPEDCN